MFFVCEGSVAPRIAQLTHADERKIAQMRYDVTSVVSPGTRIFNPESNRLIETYNLSYPESQSSNTHDNAKQCHQNKHGIQKPNLV
jgi:hypothetical protein